MLFACWPENIVEAKSDLSDLLIECMLDGRCGMGTITFPKAILQNFSDRDNQNNTSSSV